MKKISLLLVLFLCTVIGSGFAGSATISNTTPCTFYISLGGGTITNPVTGTVYNFTFGPMLVNPGTAVFANPTLLPGFSTTAPANLQASGCVAAVRISRPEIPETYPGSSAIIISNVMPSYTSTFGPACNSGNNYTMAASIGMNGCDVTLSIY